MQCNFYVTVHKYFPETLELSADLSNDLRLVTSQALNVSVKEKTLALLSKNTFNKITVKNCTERSDTDAAVASI